MGAIRSGKLAEYWRGLNHDVRVLAIDLPESIGVQVQYSSPFVNYIPFREPGDTITRIKSAVVHSFGSKRTSPVVGNPTPALAADNPQDASSIKKLGLIDLYRQALQFPDRFRNWIKPAVRLVLSWEDWNPDVIYSSGPPHVVHMVARRLGRRKQSPWIAELRDLWADDPYFDRHPLIKPLLDWTARHVISDAAACIVVTRSAQSRLQETIHSPIIVSYNGYDAKDFDGLENVHPLDTQRLTIVHAGSIYAGRRDPTPLFKAIAILGDASRNMRCLFYHDARKSVAALAARFGVSHCVEILDAIPRSQILRVERQADVLLECRWMDPAGDGVIPGKLFEYIGARRPILSLGSLTGEAAQIVRENRLGLASNEPEEIKTILLEWLEIKARHGRLPDLAPCTNDEFRRETQFQKIDAIINEMVG